MTVHAEARTPQFVHCVPCGYEWAPILLPIEMGLLVQILRSSRCPSCGSRSKDHRLGRVPRPTPVGQPHAWLQNHDTGISSETIWRVLMGETPKRADIPYDPDDFGRCYRLLKVMPEWRRRLGEVADAYPAWRSLVDAWDELTSLYEEELPTGRCPRLYARMRELRGDA